MPTIAQAVDWCAHTALFLVNLMLTTAQREPKSSRRIFSTFRSDLPIAIGSVSLVVVVTPVFMTAGHKVQQEPQS